MGLINETNAQYYSGQQAFTNSTSLGPYTWTGETLLATLPKPNFKVLKNGTELTSTIDYTINGNSITLVVAPILTDIIVIQLLEESIWDNYGSYAYTSLIDIVNNFMVAYVGLDKIIPRAKRSDVIFHAKRGLQEFSYDTLKSIKSQELTIPPSLSLIIPQDYINYVKLSYIDNVGVKHIIYPTTLTSNPYTVPLQDHDGVPTQDHLGINDEGTSQTNDKWENNNISTAGVNTQNSLFYDNGRWYNFSYGQRYGLSPEVAQSNGWFTIDEREGKFSFSSNLKGSLILLEYVSDGLSVDYDMRIPKMAEEAIYMHIAYSILAGRRNIPEYVVRRYKVDRRAALRNAKIRLSNIKLEEFTQIMRGKSKWIKH